MWWWLACTAPADTDADTDVPRTDATPTIESSAPCDACGGDCTVERLVYPAQDHVTEPVDYVDPPPAGGPHDRCWAPWGAVEPGIEDDNWVHNLEHGGVVLLWSCPDGCPTERDAIAGFVATHERTLATDVAGAPGFYAIAWGTRQRTGCYDDDATAAFYDAHFDRAPESTASTPPAGCWTADTDADR